MNCLHQRATATAGPKIFLTTHCQKHKNRKFSSKIFWLSDKTFVVFEVFSVKNFHLVENPIFCGGCGGGETVLTEIRTTFSLKELNLFKTELNFLFCPKLGKSLGFN